MHIHDNLIAYLSLLNATTAMVSELEKMCLKFLY
jgi:hypothetical protein